MRHLEIAHTYRHIKSWLLAIKRTEENKNWKCRNTKKLSYCLFVFNTLSVLFFSFIMKREFTKTNPSRPHHFRKNRFACATNTFANSRRIWTILEEISLFLSSGDRSQRSRRYHRPEFIKISCENVQEVISEAVLCMVPWTLS